MPDTTQYIQKTISEIAKEISKEFVSSVLLVDDHFDFSPKAGDDSTIDAGELINNLAKEKISVCPFWWNKEEQFDSIVNLIWTNDVSVFDWKIQLEDQYSGADLDADVKDSGDRGENAKKLLRSIIEQRVSTPHLVIIYTEEPTEVQNYLRSLYESCHLSKLQENNHVWISPEKNVRICLYFKTSSLKTHGVDETRVIHDSKEMASVIISEFAELHKGIVPLSLLHSLSILRQNTSKLLTVFNKSLDPAFLLHKALSSTPTDGDSLLLQSFLDAFSALFFYQNRDHFNFDRLVQAWLDNNSAAFTEGVFPVNVKNYQKRNLSIGHDERKKWVQEGYYVFLKEKIFEILSSSSTDKKEQIIEAIIDWISKNDTNPDFFKWMKNCFLLKNDEETMNKSNEDFAILTHHKSIFSPKQSYIPFIMLGCVIHALGKEEYFLCIQQACDCLRITDERQFLFLPLFEAPNKGFDIILHTLDNSVNKRMAVNHKKSYSLKTICFRPNDGDDVIKASKDNEECFYFTDIQGNKYIWCCDLKESFALKILNEYVQKLTRVGVDQSEWLRRS